MKSEKLTHQEVVNGLSASFRDLMSTEINSRNMPNLINRGRAAAAIVTAMHREEIMENRRQDAMNILKIAEAPTISKLKQIKK
jgi:hypothetical protein